MPKTLTSRGNKRNIKDILLACAVFLTALSASGQSIEPPNHEPFSFRLSEDRLDMARGSEKTVNLTLLKSKQYLKSKIKISLASSLPAGMLVTFSLNNDVFYTSVVTISASAEMAPGTYSLLVSCTVSGKSKSTILKVVVT